MIRIGFQPHKVRLYFIIALVCLASLGAIETGKDCWSPTQYDYSVITPVKINLDGRNAELNTDDKFTLDVDGFTQETEARRNTPGGLNANEAWLVFDRENNGIWLRSSIDNDDLFGDHGGRVSSGYADLSHTFSHEIKTNDKGEHFIDLTGYNWFGLVQLWVSRKLLGDKTPYAAYDLELLTLDKRLLPARETLRKIYVDARDVREYDNEHANVIIKRAPVEYLDGHTADSADQYFIYVLGAIRKLTPEEEAAFRKQLQK